MGGFYSGSGQVENQGSGTIAALNDAVTITTPTAATGVLVISGTWTGTLVFEISVDGITYSSTTAVTIPGSVSSTQTTVNGTFGVALGGYYSFRVRANSAVTGTATVTWNTDTSPNRSLSPAALIGSTDGTPIGNVLDALKTSATLAAQSLATYSASVTGISVAAAATDIITITGSASKKVIVNQVNISGAQTTAGIGNISLVKRSTLNTGGGVGTIVQTANAFTSTSSTTASVTFSSTAAGNLLIIAAANLDNRTVSSVSDGTSAFTQATSAAGNSGGQNGRTDIWYLTSSNSGKTSATVTFSGTSTTKQLYFWEVSGTSVGFQTANNTQNTTIANPALGAAVTSTGPGIVVGAMVTGSGSTGVITAAPDAANTQFTSGTVGNSGKSAAEWVLGQALAYTPTYTLTGSGPATGSSTAAFTATGNTVPTLTAVPHDSADAAATAVVKRYLGNPTLGTSVGSIRSICTFMPTTTGAPAYVSWDFSKLTSKGIVLNNANESLNINFNGQTIPGSNISIDIMWTEQ